MKALLKVALLLAAMPLKAAVIYDGESAPFSASSGWDGNGSTLKQVAVSPFSKANHLRANLKVKNWWAAAAYVPKAWQPVAMGKKLSMMIKSSSTHELLIQIQDSNKKVSDLHKILVDSSYRKIEIPACAFTGADPEKTTAIIFAVSLKGASTYTLDIDDIEAGDSSPAPAPEPAPQPSSGSLQAKARALVQDLTGRPYFLTGGTFGPDPKTKIDVYYRYLVGGWRKWNAPDGEYALMIMREAEKLGAVPMFTYYKLAFEFEKKNYGMLMHEELHEYLQDMRVLMQRIGAFNKPVLVHLEPDFYGYMQQYSVDIKKTVQAIPARIRHTDIPECMAMDEWATNIMPCVAAIRDKLAPKARLGLHASQWGDWYDMNDPNAPAQQKSYSVADFLKLMGSDKMDFVTVETSDRDAGYLEVTRGAKNAYCPDVSCERGRLTWAGYIAERAQKPILWWQMPFGVPSSNPGTKDHYRDARVPIYYGIVPELVRMGSFGMLFGAGAGEQTTNETDGGQFKRYNDKYQSSRIEIR